MLEPYNASASAPYYGAYYRAQAGGELDVFAGRSVMGGKGLGGIFKGMMRMATPLLKKVGAKVGRQALSAGKKLASDVIAGKNLKRSLRERGKEAGTALLGDILGGGGPSPPKRKRRTPAKSRGRAAPKRSGRRLVI